MSKHIKIASRSVLLALLCLSTASGHALAEEGGPPGGESPFKGILDAAEKLFVPLSGTVKGVEDGIIISTDLGSSSGAAKGTRVSILRKGRPFVHPLTKEPMGWSETNIGTAEFVEVTPEGSRLRALSGEAREGDLLRRSSAPVRVLFYQSTSVDWDVAEEYYLQLKGRDRFDIFDTAPGSATDDVIAADARKVGAEAAIVLAAERLPGKVMLRQRLIWAADAAEFGMSELEMDDKTVVGYKFGEEMFAPKKNVPLLTFRMPAPVELVAVGDMDGDGSKELALGNGGDVKFYTMGLSLSPAYEGAEIKSGMGENVWLEIHDLDGDGRDEVIVSALDSFRAASAVYKLIGGSFNAVLKKPNTFLRVIGGRLYGQEYSRSAGFKGGLLPLSLDGSVAEVQPLTLPRDLNIYDFSPFPTPADADSKLAYDNRGYVVLYSGGGEAVWRSSDSYAKPIKQYEAEKMSELSPPRKWTVKDRIIVKGGSALAIAREPLTSLTAGGIWYKGSNIMKLYWKDGAVGESIVLGEIPGKLLDYAVADNKAYVLLGSMGVVPENILRGRSLFGTKLYVYSLNGN